MNEKLLTLKEIAEKLRVSRHTVQAWISPSSPNHKPEFANLARHSGRKTLFLESEVDTWLNQRKGALYSTNLSLTSAYWREKFISSKGLLKNTLKISQNIVKGTKRSFNSGKLALDYEPLIIWLTDSDYSNDILNIVNKSDGLILAVPVVWWFLRRIMRNKKQYLNLKKFFLEDNIFELAPMNEESLKKSLELPSLAGELSIQAYACTNNAGASSLLTANQILLKTKGLSVCSF